MGAISRVCVEAKPEQDHPEYREWQTANLAVFVRASSRLDAIRAARKVLEDARWAVIKIELCDLLVEARVEAQGGPVLDAYRRAQRDGHALTVFPKHFGAGTDVGVPMRPPRVTEGFMDQVVVDAGGERLETDGSTRLADYRIDDWIFELKDLQQEGLEKEERQRKLADLFARFASDDSPIRIEPSVLNEDEYRQYLDIISRPIQGQVKSASKQIRATKQRLGDDLHGGLIYVNTGYGSFPPDEFGPLVERYVAKDTSQIEAVLTVTTWNVTNGFDSEIFYRMHPDDPQQEVVRRLQDAFAGRFEEAMTKLIRGQLDGATLVDPLQPHAFVVDGLDFAWVPPELPPTWRSNG